MATYDALNRLKKQTYADGKVVTYNYDETFGGTSYGVGHLTSMTDPSGSTTWTYDQRGHKLQEKQTITVGTGSVTLTTTNTYNNVTGKLASESG